MHVASDLLALRLGAGPRSSLGPGTCRQDWPAVLEISVYKGKCFAVRPGGGGRGGDPVSPAPPSPPPGRPAGRSGGRENRSPSEGSGSSPRKCFRCGGSGPRRPEGCGRSRVSGQPPLRGGSRGGGYPTKAPVAGPAILNLRKEVGAGTGRPVDRAGLRWPGQPRPLGLVARSSVAWRAGRFPVPPAPHLACPCSCPARGPGRGCGCRWTPLCLTGGGAAVRAPGGILG